MPLYFLQWNHNLCKYRLTDVPSDHMPDPIYQIECSEHEATVVNYNIEREVSQGIDRAEESIEVIKDFENIKKQVEDADNVAYLQWTSIDNYLILRREIHPNGDPPVLWVQCDDEDMHSINSRVYGEIRNTSDSGPVVEVIKDHALKIHWME